MSKTLEIQAQFSAMHVLIVGDVMTDRYYHGKVQRISPEAPVPVVEWQRTEDRLGGAANVALNIKALGATAWLFSVVGKDTEGGCFQKLLTANGLATRGILPSANRSTTVKTRIMAGTQQMLRLDAETVADLDDETQAVFVQKIRDFLDVQQVDIIIFQDYNKGVLSLKTIRDVLLEAVRRDIPTAVDPKRTNFLAYRQATLFKPNLKEIRDAVPFPIETDAASLAKAAAYLHEQIGNRLTMITLSEKGLFLMENTKGSSEGKIYPTQPRSISDVSGAGDTVISVAALGLAAGLSFADVAVLSNLAGSQVCEKAGVVPVDLGQLLREFEGITKQ